MFTTDYDDILAHEAALEKAADKAQRVVDNFVDALMIPFR